MKILLFFTCIAGGYYIAGVAYGFNPKLGIWGALIGLAAAIAALGLEMFFQSLDPKAITGGFAGLVIGLIAAQLVIRALGAGLADINPKLHASALLFLSVLLGYAGAAIGLRAELWKIAEPGLGQADAANKPREISNKILDTSVIIDGRIADISETGFLEGTFVIPQFVLRELQHIADSSDSLKRNRGRRGLDILHKIQKKVEINVKIEDTDFPRIREVDAKLIALAKKIGGKIITNDFNLNKIAELQGVTVLNINQLANALKPVVLPGELMKVYVLKEGKEANQGVAYLDDGTMVVIDNAKKEIGKNIEVLVTSVLQTTAGRMIFTQIKDDSIRNGQ